MTRRPHQQGRSSRWVDAAQWRLADEVRYIQRRAAAYDGRIVTIGPLVLFSTDTGDAWVLDPADHLAMPVARESAALPVPIVEDTDTRFAIDWTGHYRIDGEAFVYVDKDTGQVRTILGYPTRLIAQSLTTVPTAGWGGGSLPTVTGSPLPRPQRSRARSGPQAEPLRAGEAGDTSSDEGRQAP